MRSHSAREGAYAVSVDIGDQSGPAPRRKRWARSSTAYTEDFGKLTQKGAADLVRQIVKDSGRWTFS